MDEMSLANRKVDGMPTFLKKVSLILIELYHILILKAMLIKVMPRLWGSQYMALNQRDILW